jgi:hypothetical protein
MVHNLQRGRHAANINLPVRFFNQSRFFLFGALQNFSHFFYSKKIATVPIISREKIMAL